MRNTIRFLACFLAGCSGSADSVTVPKERPMLVDVQTIIAKQLNKSTNEIKPDSTFAALGMDDLDLVEITMEVEDQFSISIGDDALLNAAGIKESELLCQHLTVRAFAKVAGSSSKSPAPLKPADLPDDGILRESQAGTYADLVRLQNPNNLVLVFTPSLEVLTARLESDLGRKMNEDELQLLRDRAAVIALPVKRLTSGFTSDNKWPEK